MEQPKDYPMGKAAQIMYAFRKACLWAFVGLWVAATIKFAIMTLRAM